MLRVGGTLNAGGINVAGAGFGGYGGRGGGAHEWEFEDRRDRGIRFGRDDGNSDGWESVDAFIPDSAPVVPREDLVETLTVRLDEVLISESCVGEGVFPRHR